MGKAVVPGSCTVTILANQTRGTGGCRSDALPHFWQPRSRSPIALSLHHSELEHAGLQVWRTPFQPPSSSSRHALRPAQRACVRNRGRAGVTAVSKKRCRYAAAIVRLYRHLLACGSHCSVIAGTAARGPGLRRAGRRDGWHRQYGYHGQPHQAGWEVGLCLCQVRGRVNDPIIHLSASDAPHGRPVLWAPR
jgi:hypothetical protein